MWWLVAIGLGLVGAAVASDKAKTSSKPPEAGAGAAAPKAPTADELKAQGRAEALAEVAAQKKAERELEVRVKRIMGSSPRARVSKPADEGDDTDPGAN